MRRPYCLAFLLLPLALLTGCELLGTESPETVAARKEAEGKAVGGACRHAGRAIEDCFALNKRSDKAAVFAGWREMNDYMRENNMNAVSAQGSSATGAEAHADEAAHDDSAPEKPGKANKHES
jgi:hypothetical protein